MSFLKRLFSGGNKAAYVDKNGIYLYARCDNCGTIVRVRADKQHDLNREGNGFSWHKTIVDSKCFRRMQAIVQFNGDYHVSSYELSGGTLVDETAYQESLKPNEEENPTVDESEA